MVAGGVAIRNSRLLRDGAVTATLNGQREDEPHDRTQDRSMTNRDLRRLRDLLLDLYEDDEVDDTKRTAISIAREAALDILLSRGVDE
jgi:hypothetical protein